MDYKERATEDLRNTRKLMLLELNTADYLMPTETRLTLQARIAEINGILKERKNEDQRKMLNYEECSTKSLTDTKRLIQLEINTAGHAISLKALLMLQTIIAKINGILDERMNKEACLK